MKRLYFRVYELDLLCGSLWVKYGQVTRCFDFGAVFIFNLSFTPGFGVVFSCLFKITGGVTIFQVNMMAQNVFPHSRVSLPFFFFALIYFLQSFLDFISSFLFGYRARRNVKK